MGKRIYLSTLTSQIPSLPTSRPTILTISAKPHRLAPINTRTPFIYRSHSLLNPFTSLIYFIISLPWLVYLTRLTHLVTQMWVRLTQLTYLPRLTIFKWGAMGEPPEEAPNKPTTRSNEKLFFRL